MITGLYTIFTAELFLGGGGRLLSFGPITARMILFALCLLAWTLIIIKTKKIDYSGHRLAACLVSLFALSHFPAIINGVFQGYDPNIIFTEFQQALFWLSAPFFAYVLRDISMVERTARLIQKAGVTLAILYLIIVTLLTTNVIDTTLFYSIANATTEFKFRTETLFFYKGFLYLGIALVFFVSLRNKNWKKWTFLLLMALSLTLTRGFLISTFIALALLTVMHHRSKFTFFAFAIATSISVFLFFYLTETNSDIAGNRLISNSQRIEDISFVLSNADAFTLVLGEGYGSLINDRIGNENSFLWALWKLGFIGLIFWLLPFAICSYYFLKIRRVSRNNLAAGFYFGVILLYIQTATNPYINNPIGLSYLIIAIFSLRTIAFGRLSGKPTVRKIDCDSLCKPAPDMERGLSNPIST